MIELAASGIETSPLLLVGVGFLVGLFGGLLGLGGGWLIVPALSVMGVRAVMCIGTSLAAMTVSSAVGVAKHASKGRVRWKMGLGLAAFSICGVEIGKRIVLALASSGSAETVLKLIYLVLLAFLGTTMARGGKKTEGAGGAAEVLPEIRAVRWYHLAAVGLASGTMAGILGIGGGIVIVPLLTWLYAMPVATAVATGLVSVLGASIYGAIAYGLAREVDLVIAALIAVGGVAGSFTGAALAHRAKDAELRRLFAMQAGATMLGVVMQLVGRPDAAKILVFGGAALLGSWTIVSLARARPEDPAAGA